MSDLQPEDHQTKKQKGSISTIAVAANTGDDGDGGGGKDGGTKKMYFERQAYHYLAASSLPPGKKQGRPKGNKVDDEGRQTKKQKFTFKREIPTKEQTTCCTKNCSKQAISTWKSNLNPGYYRNVCFDCQQDKIGGLPHGVVSIITTQKRKQSAIVPAPKRQKRKKVTQEDALVKQQKKNTILIIVLVSHLLL